MQNQRIFPKNQRNIISNGVVRESAIASVYNALQYHNIQCQKSYVYKYKELSIPKSTKIDIIGNDFIIKVSLQRYWKNALIDLNRQNNLVAMRFKVLYLYENKNSTLIIPSTDLFNIKRYCKSHKISVITNTQQSINSLCKAILHKIPYSTIA